MHPVLLGAARTYIIRLYILASPPLTSRGAVLCCFVSSALRYPSARAPSYDVRWGDASS